MLELKNNQNPPEQFKKTPVNFIDQTQAKKPFFKNKKSLFLFAVIFISLVFGSVFLVRAFNQPEKINNPYEYDPITLEPKKPENFIQKIASLVFKKQPTLEGQSKDRINVLLLGIGGPGHDGPFLSDTIMIASIKPSTGQIAMISVPRDLGVDIPGYGLQKINHVNAYGENKKEGFGSAYTAKTISELLDIEIPYYVRVDFEAFKEIIDAVGGIKINVEQSFIDREFPAPNDKYQSLTFTSGVQTMDGTRALQYARSRHGDNGEGSDFARAKRQQKVILALKEKVLSFQTLANPVRLNKIINSLGAHINTNIELSDMVSFLKVARSTDLSNIITLVFDIEKSGFLESYTTKQSGYTLRPTTGNFDAMKLAIANIFDTLGEKDNTPTQGTPAPPSINIELADGGEQRIDKKFNTDIVEVQNGTWSAGLAARIKDRLVKNDLEILDIGNTQTRSVPESGIYIISPVFDLNTVDKIKKELNINLKETLPQGEMAASTTNILVILGEDFTE